MSLSVLPNHLIHTQPAASLPFSNPQEVADLFPKSVEEIKTIAQQAETNLEQAIARIISLPDSERNFQTVAYALDDATEQFSRSCSRIKMLEQVSPNDEIRKIAHEKVIDLRGRVFITLISDNKELYLVFQSYIDNIAVAEHVTPEQKRYLTKVIEDWHRSGIHLDVESRTKITGLQKDITKLLSDFLGNVNIFQRSITVTKEDLDGCSEDFIANLEMRDGLYVLRTDYPTYDMVANNCKVEATRKKMFLAFTTRAYPENISVLNELIKKRHELANLLGYETFATYDCADQMALNPEKVHSFIAEVVDKVTSKYDAEFATYTTHLPVEVSLSPEGTIKPWDMAYIQNQYKKNNFSIDEAAIAEYFPAEHTLRGLIAIYEKFMNIKISQIALDGLWHPDVQVLQIFDQTNQLRGYILLDLYPRPNKFSHAASFPIVASRLEQGVPSPAVNVVVANFPKPTAHKPALLTHQDATVFFHEFGHAIHCVLGGTEMALFSGTRVKTDFVELPSQMLEEWMWDKEILKQLSHHYRTGQPLPDEIIDKKLALRKLGAAFSTLRQLTFASISLAVYTQGHTTDIEKLYRSICEKFTYHTAFDPDSHLLYSFNHLAPYAAKYYGYMWSSVFAKDVFSEITKHGLLNPEVGQKYVNTILAKGGSEEPHDLLVKFLGREPNSQAFFEALL